MKPVDEQLAILMRGGDARRAGGGPGGVPLLPFTVSYADRRIVP